MSKNTNPLTLTSTTINGVELLRENGKFIFNSRKADGSVYTMIHSGRIGIAKANGIVKAIGASNKRGFVGANIDPMAAGQIRKIVAAKTYKGIDFNFSFDA